MLKIYSLTLLLLIISSCVSSLKLEERYSFQDLESEFNLNKIWSDQIYYDGERLDMVYVMKDTISLSYYILLASNVKGGGATSKHFIEDSLEVESGDTINNSQVAYGHAVFINSSEILTFQVENYIEVVPETGQIVSGTYSYQGEFGHYLTLENSADSLKGAIPKAWRINEELYQFIPIECDSLYRDSIEIFCSDI